MSVFIGLDQSYTSTGYCVLSNDVNLKSPVVEFDIIKTSAEDGNMYTRAIKVTNAIVALCKKYPTADVAIEGLSFGQRGNATRDLAGLQYVIITALITQLNINNTKIVAPQSVKKFATGGGGSAKKKVTKIDMVNALPEYVLNAFASRGFKKSKGLYDLTDAYWISKFIFKPQESIPEP